MSYLAIGIRCLIGGVFLAAFLSKARGLPAFRAFVASIHGMRVLPPRLVTPAAVLVTAGEAAVCALVAAPFSSVAAVVGCAAATALLMTFTTAIALAVRRGVRQPCRCFGASDTPLGTLHLARNTALTCLAGVGTLVTTAATRAAGPVHVGGGTVAAAAGLLLGLLITVLDDVVALFAPADRRH
ncbi:MauE/DoxX family redox-associated membrane protein [Streptomyces sp. GMR22]|uniref:MauE/DoxX family redox-associated membrane protein n=1 Tax=Streptomyces sp. GMR22 TaxID=2759524 RepID=UPI0015FE2EAB|nr:MauE/DoxX family redox-associated membrane protein [Streptomyces sp. GMR22]MBA6440345.1 methylamine utilization protein MauE [Streptomyces sp. GMR22]